MICHLKEMKCLSYVKYIIFKSATLKNIEERKADRLPGHNGKVKHM